MKPQLTTAPIRSTLIQIAAPAAIGSLFQILYNIVDSWYAAKISTTALAGLSLSFPVYFIFVAVAVGFSSAATSLMGQALGAKDSEKARGVAWQTLSFGVVIGVLILVVGVWVNREVFAFLGASGQFLDYASLYMTTLFFAAPIILMPAMLNAGLIAQGLTQVYRNVLVCAFFANLLLNPWFIYGGFGVPAMGVQGIALATIVAQGGASAWLFYKLYKTGLLGAIHVGLLKPRWAYFSEILRQGTPQFLNMMSIGAFFFIANSYVTRFGEQAVAAYGIGLRIEQLILVPSIAVNQAALALVSNNYGAKLYDRVREAWRVAIQAGLAILGFGAIFLLLLAEPLMRLFTQDAAVIEVGMGYLNIEAFTVVAYVFIHVNGGVLQGLKRPNAIMWAGLLRTFLLPLLLLPLIIDHLGFGLHGIWWMLFALSWSTGLCLHWHTRRVVREMCTDPSVQNAT